MLAYATQIAIQQPLLQFGWIVGPSVFLRDESSARACALVALATEDCILSIIADSISKPQPSM
jgi:hypothetical protein